MDGGEADIDQQDGRVEAVETYLHTYGSELDGIQFPSSSLESQEDTYPLSNLNTRCSSVSSADMWTVLTVCSGTTTDRLSR